MSIESKLGMTQKEVASLPELECPEGAYEHIKQHYTCPKCKSPLKTAKSGSVTEDNIRMPAQVQTTIIYAAGCEECGILYRFKDNPITFTKER